MTTNSFDTGIRFDSGIRCSARQADGWRWRARRRRSAFRAALTAAFILLLPASASAVQITGSLTDMPDRIPGQNLWRATYTVSNWSGYAAGTGFSIEVPLWGTGHGVVDAASGGGAGWQVVALQRDPNLPATGRLDARSTTFSPSLSSPFHLDFVWNGPGATPALPNFYRVYNSSYDTIESGIVFAPEPGASTCAIAALVALSLLAQRRRGNETPRRKSQPRSLRRLGVVLIGTLLAGGASASTAGVEHLTSAGNYDIRFMVATDLGNRINQTQVEYPVVVTVTNRGSDSRDFTLSVSGGSSYTQVVQSTLDFNGLGFNQSQTSQQMLTFRHNRQYAFDPGALGWVIEYPATIVRVINDLTSQNPWGPYNAILWLRVGPTESSVGGPPPNSYEKLDDRNTSSFIGDQLSAGGSSRDYDVSSLSPNYWIFAQAGWWDYVFSPYGGWWEKHATNVMNCFGQAGNANLWTTIRVTGHQSGVQEVYLSNFLPSYGTWQGMPACQ